MLNNNFNVYSISLKFWFNWNPEWLLLRIMRRRRALKFWFNWNPEWVLLKIVRRRRTCPISMIYWHLLMCIKCNYKSPLVNIYNFEIISSPKFCKVSFLLSNSILKNKIMDQHLSVEWDKILYSIKGLVLNQGNNMGPSEGWSSTYCVKRYLSYNGEQCMRRSIDKPSHNSSIFTKSLLWGICNGSRKMTHTQYCGCKYNL
jgi:hypothetical protein